MLLDLLLEATGRRDDKISVIIPCYNRERYISECLDNVINQTMPLNMLEIIIVDDCSTDKTREILHEYEARFPENIMIVECEEQSGGYIGKVRNIGMSYASGNYICFVDSDDKIELDMLEKMYMKAVLYNAEVVSCGYRAFVSDDIYSIFNRTERLYDMSKPEEKKFLFMNEGIGGSVWGKMYDSRFLKDNNIMFSEELRLAEDNLFHGSVISCVKKYYSTSESLYMYRQNPESVWNNVKALNNVTDCFRAQEMLYDLCKEANRDVIDEFAWAVYGELLEIKKKCKSMGQDDLFRQLFPQFKNSINRMFPNLRKSTYIYQDRDKDNVELYTELLKDDDYRADIYNHTVYILAPENGKSGGPELLHQLARALMDLGITAKMAYFNGEGKIVKANPVKEYEKYKTVAESDISVIDQVGNCVIIPEEAVILSRSYNKCQRIIWWLSVDNYIESFYIQQCLKNEDNLDPLDFEHDKSFYHMVQSWYAMDFLYSTIKVDSDRIAYLSDYVNDCFVDEKYDFEKENIIMYNPKKGKAELDKIISKSPQFRWMPIMNMTPDEVHQNLCKAKLYIDFGKHPGKDRIPREAAISGCCVITNKKGAAAFSKDVPILEEYKYDNIDENVDNIIAQIENIFNDYQSNSEKFDNYRQMIASEKGWFYTDVKNVFTNELWRTAVKSNVSFVVKDNKCVGCGACKASCKVNAISLERNQKGFYVPHINDSLCYSCEKCLRVCPQNDTVVNTEAKEMNFYALKAVDEVFRSNSQSGGAFSAIASAFINDSGIVYGVILDEEHKVRYDRVEASEDLYKLKKSKYAQSFCGDVFSNVKDDLLLERKVLFSGTPCAIKGLVSFLSNEGVNLDNLYTIDLVCHGVASPRLYEDYINYYEKIYNCKVKEFIFRDKSFGWKNHVETVRLENGDEINSTKYATLFGTDIALNESCYNCKYTMCERVSDVTIGDFWGIEKVLPQIDDNRGVSLVIARGEKGQQLLKSAETSVKLYPVGKKDCLQPNLIHPTKRPENVDAFWKDYLEKDFRYAIKKYQFNPFDHNANAYVTLKWKEFLEKGFELHMFFEQHSIKRVALCGIPDRNELIGMNILKNGVDIISIIDWNNEYPGDLSDVVKIKDVNSSLMESVDCVIVTDEEFMPEIVMEFAKNNLDLDKLLPFSYVVTLEATCE